MTNSMWKDVKMFNLINNKEIIYTYIFYVLYKSGKFIYVTYKLYEMPFISSDQQELKAPSIRDGME